MVGRQGGSPPSGDAADTNMLVPRITRRADAKPLADIIIHDPQPDTIIVLEAREI